MSLLTKIFGKKKAIAFSGVQTVSIKDFNDRRCPNCNKPTLRVDEYEQIPIAFCKWFNGEFQPA